MAYDGVVRAAQLGTDVPAATLTTPGSSRSFSRAASVN